MVLETNCIRQPNRELPNHNTLTTFRTSYEGVITNAPQSCSKEVVPGEGSTAVMREFSACIVVAR